MADTIKILNDDDALELFKETLLGKTVSLLQMKVSANEIRMKALGEKNTYCEEVFEKIEDKPSTPVPWRSRREVRAWVAAIRVTSRMMSAL